MTTHADPETGGVAHATPWRIVVARRHWKGLAAALVVGLLLLTVALRIDGLGGERRALQGMAPGARRALYDETLRNAEALCAHAQAERALLDRCVDSTEFLLAFPECDDACRAFARTHQPAPSR